MYIYLYKCNLYKYIYIYKLIMIYMIFKLFEFRCSNLSYNFNVHLFIFQGVLFDR